MLSFLRATASNVPAVIIQLPVCAKAIVALRRAIQPGQEHKAGNDSHFALADENGANSGVSYLLRHKATAPPIINPPSGSNTQITPNSGSRPTLVRNTAGTIAAAANTTPRISRMMLKILFILMTSFTTALHNRPTQAKPPFPGLYLQFLIGSVPSLFQYRVVSYLPSFRKDYARFLVTPSLYHPL